MTWDRLQAEDAVAHEQSRVSVHLTQSIIRSPGGGDGIFVINFASGSHIELHLRRNVIGRRRCQRRGESARLDCRCDGVDSVDGNLYRADTSRSRDRLATYNGGTDAPMLAP